MNEGEFAAIWRECFPRVFRYCRFRTATLADAEDVAAETFARLLLQPTMPEAKALPWLYRVARNLSIDTVRRTARELPLAEAGPAACEIETPWRDPQLWNAVRRLAPDQQLAVYLRLVEDRTFRDVGMLLGRSEAAAKMLYRRAVGRLAKVLEVSDHVAS